MSTTFLKKFFEGGKFSLKEEWLSKLEFSGQV